MVAIFSILAVVSSYFYQSFQISYQLDAAVDELVQNLRRSQARAMASEGDSSHGIYFVSGYGAVYTMFRGDNYLEREPDYDEEFTLPNSLFLTYNFGGGEEIVFSKLRGSPNSEGNIIINSINGGSSTIIINSAGRVEKQ